MNTNERISTWVNRIDHVTKQVESVFGALSDAQLNQKPDPNTWSIAENLEHLILVNESYYPLIDSVRKGEMRLGWSSKLGFLRNVLAKMILGSVEPTRKRKMKTFPIWTPAASSITPQAVIRFVEHQKQLAAFISSCNDLLEKGQVICSPANKNITYTLAQAFEIIVTHEERHLNQAKEVVRSLT